MKPNGLLKSCLNKRVYRSELLAEAAATRSCIDFDKPMSVYKCPYCEFWHLTSQVKK